MPNWKQIVVGDAFKISPGGFNHYRDLFLMWPFLLFSIIAISNIFFVRSCTAVLCLESKPLRGLDHPVGEGQIDSIYGCTVLRGGSPSGCSTVRSRLEGAVGDSTLLRRLGRSHLLSNLRELEAQLRNG
jgi:hypothetical protein